jgi:hypothetical protein
MRDIAGRVHAETNVRYVTLRYDPHSQFRAGHDFRATFPNRPWAYLGQMEVD